MSFPARLHILSRPNLNKVLIIRRGPSKRVGFFGFDLATYELTQGQWLKGKIYERRSDLSPDGKYIIYFALNGKWKSETKGAWTALSRFPYLKAIDLWAKGDAWNGGGLFLDKKTYHLNERFPHKSLYKNSDFEVKRGKIEAPIVTNECRGVYFPRLIREGWTMIKSEGKNHFFEKKYDKEWHILKRCGVNQSDQPGRSVYYDSNQLIHKNAGLILDIASDWMDFRDEKIYWTKQGKIHKADLGKEKIIDERVIVDMNEYQFKAIQAPY